MIISRMVAAQARVRVYKRSCADGEEIVRQVCLTRLVSDLVIDGAHRLVLDARADRDAHDQRTIRAVLGKHPRDLGLTYEHLTGLHPSPTSHVRTPLEQNLTRS